MGSGSLKHFNCGCRDYFCIDIEMEPQCQTWRNFVFLRLLPNLSPPGACEKVLCVFRFYPPTFDYSSFFFHGDASAALRVEGRAAPFVLINTDVRGHREDGAFCVVSQIIPICPLTSSFCDCHRGFGVFEDLKRSVPAQCAGIPGTSPGTLISTG